MTLNFDLNPINVPFSSYFFIPDLPGRLAESTVDNSILENKGAES